MYDGNAWRIADELEVTLSLVSDYKEMLHDSVAL